MHLGDVNADTPSEIVELFANHFESSYAADDDEWNVNNII